MLYERIIHYLLNSRVGIIALLQYDQYATHAVRVVCHSHKKVYSEETFRSFLLISKIHKNPFNDATFK